MKWFKRLLLFVVFLAVFAIALAAAGWWMSHRPPDWYTQRHISGAESAAAAHRAEQEVQRTLSWAQDQQAFSDSSRVGAPSTVPAKTLQISLTEDELNGFFQKWDSAFDWSKSYDAYVSEPQIVLRDGRLIFAATVKQMSSVLSVELTPRLEEGKLHMPVSQVLAGRLPLPQSFWDRYRDALTRKMQGSLPRWEEGAEIRPNGTANPDAVAAAMSQLLMDVLNGKPARPVLFLPYDVSSGQRSLPVKLTDLKIENKTLELTVQPLSPREKDALIQSIREPDGVQTGGNAPAARAE